MQSCANAILTKHTLPALSLNSQFSTACPRPVLHSLRPSASTVSAWLAMQLLACLEAVMDGNEIACPPACPETMNYGPGDRLSGRDDTIMDDSACSILQPV